MVLWRLGEQKGTYVVVRHIRHVHNMCRKDMYTGAPRLGDYGVVVCLHEESPRSEMTAEGTEPAGRAPFCAMSALPVGALPSASP